MVNCSFKIWYASILPMLISCTSNHQVYQSSCNAGQTFRKINLHQLITHLSQYNGLYVEVSGRYQSGRELAALADSSRLYSAGTTDMLWIEYSQECPLYEQQKHTGLFEETGLYARLNNKNIIIRGRINIRNHGYRKQYKAALEQVSLLQW